MKRKLTGNLSLKLLSLVVGLVIWLLVENINNPTRTKLFNNIEINVINEDSVTEIDKVYDIVSGQNVVIKVTERKSILDDLSASDFTVVADMENLNEMNSIPLTVTCSNPAVSWDEIEVSPASMKVKLEQKKQSEFVVNVSTVGEPQDGYVVGATEVVGGKTVQIAGPESMINRIGRVVASVNTLRIKSDQRLEGALTVYDKDDVKFTDAELRRLQIKDSGGVLLADNVVMVDVSVWEVMSGIPVEVELEGEPAEGYRIAKVSIIPVTVSLVGTQEALAELNGKLVLNDTVSVEGATESFTADLDITQTLNDIDELELNSETDPTITVTVQIEKTSDQTLNIPLSNLEVLNRPNDMALTFSPADEVEVSVHSDEENAVLRISDIKASIDLAACAEPGTYEIPVEIELPDGYTLISEVKLVVTAVSQEQPIENSTENAEG